MRIGEKIFEPQNLKPNDDAGGERSSSTKEDEETEDTDACEHHNAESFHETIVEEGAEGSGAEIRSTLSIPPDSNGRKRHFLTQSNRENFTFEAGRLYQSDFGNPYLDFNDFSLKLPGFSLNVIQYVDEQLHELRYVLKNRTTDDIYAVVLFSLLFGDERDKIGQKDHPPLNEEAPRTAEMSKDKRDDTVPTEDMDFGDERPPAEDDVD